MDTVPFHLQPHRDLLTKFCIGIVLTQYKDALIQSRTRCEREQGIRTSFWVPSKEDQVSKTHADTRFSRRHFQRQSQIDGKSRPPI